MRGVLAVALAVAALVFSALCVGASLAFGAGLQVGRGLRHLCTSAARGAGLLETRFDG